jgi:hypothetical protein
MRILAALLLCGAAHAGPHCEVIPGPPLEPADEISVGLYRVEPDIEPRDAERVREAAALVQAEFRAVGIDLTVTGYTLESDCERGLFGDCWSEMSGHTHYHLWGGYSGQWCGRAFMPGNRAWTAGNCGTDTLRHEQAHNLGIEHSGDGGWQYGWKTWQGAGSGRSEWAARHIAMMGGDVHVSRGEGLYFVVSAYAPLRDGETHAVEVGEYWVSLWGGRVVIDRRDGPRIWLVATVRPGEVISVDGLRVENVASREGATKVRIGEHTLDAEWPEWGAPERIAEGLYSGGEATHQGVFVYHVQGTQVIYWLTWDRRLNQRWYWSVDGRIYTTLDREPVEVGRGRIAGGAWHYYTEDLGRGSLPLDRLIASPDDDPLHGHYGLGDGNGAVLQVSGERVYGFVLDHVEPDLINVHGQRWQLIEGCIGETWQTWVPEMGYPGVQLPTRLIDAGPLNHSNGIFNGIRSRMIH